MNKPLKFLHVLETATQCQACPIREDALFRGVPVQQLDLLQKYRSEQYEVSDKTLLYEQTQRHPYAYTVYSGWVALFKLLPDGQRQILRYALPGDFLGFQSDIQGPMLHSAMTLNHCTLCAFPRDSFEEMLHAAPALAMELAKFAARDYESLASMGRKSAKERIALLFHDLFHRTHKQNAQQQSFAHFPLTQEDIADTLGLTPVHVNRTLKQLREEGVLEFVHQKFVLHNMDTLRELAGVSEEMPNSPVI